MFAFIPELPYWAWALVAGTGWGAVYGVSEGVDSYESWSWKRKPLILKGAPASVEAGVNFCDKAGHFAWYMTTHVVVGASSFVVSPLFWVFSSRKSDDEPNDDKPKVRRRSARLLADNDELGQ